MNAPPNKKYDTNACTQIRMSDLDPDHEVGSKFIIIQPGSLNLYIGFADDAEPKCIPHVIAYRVISNSTSSPNQQENFNFEPNLPIDRIDKFDVTPLMNVATTLKLMHGDTNPTFEFHQKEFNEKLTFSSSVITDGDNFTSDSQIVFDEFIIGNQLFEINPRIPPNYAVKWIYKDILNNPSISYLTGLDKNLINLHWSNSINKLFESRNILMNLPEYKFILLVPDFFNRASIVTMVDVLFNTLEFSGGLIIQESVAVSYYARMQSVCVVDIGHSKASISCVEEGVSIPISRIKLNVGGSTVSSALYCLLKQSSFPVVDLNPFENPYHFKILDNLKKDVCHLTPEGRAGKHYFIDWNPPGITTSQLVEFMLGEEGLLCSTVYFSAPFLSLIDTKIAIPFQYLDYNTADDIFNKLNNIESLPVTSEEQSQRQEIDFGSPSVAEDENSVTDSSPEEIQNLTDSNPKINSSSGYTPLHLESSIMSLGEAIIKSILTCDDFEQQSRLFSNIFLVGGGFIIDGARDFLQYRIEAQLPRKKRYKKVVVDVTDEMVDCHPCHAAFKGACNFSQIQTIDELVLTRFNWIAHGTRLLRERALFQWNP